MGADYDPRASIWGTGAAILTMYLAILGVGLVAAIVTGGSALWTAVIMANVIVLVVTVAWCKRRRR